MPKIRTHSGTAKRIKTSKTGKLQHGHAFTSHLLQKRSASSRRANSVNGVLSGKAKTNVKRALGA